MIPWLALKVRVHPVSANGRRRWHRAGLAGHVGTGILAEFFLTFFHWQIAVSAIETHHWVTTNIRLKVETGTAIGPVMQGDMGSLQNHVWVMDTFLKLRICKRFAM